MRYGHSWLHAWVLCGTVAGAPAVAGTAQLAPAWEEWRSHRAEPSAAQRATVREGEARARQVREAVQEAEGRGAYTAFERAGTAAEWISKGLGYAEEAGDTLDELERAAKDEGAPRAAAAVRSVREALERAGILDPADRDYEPREVPDGQPDVPSSCEGISECLQCYVPAMDGLNATRLRLEKLRALYASTYKYAKAKISFADGASAVHGVSALAWQKYKSGVNASLKQLDRAYDDKYAELMERLLSDLEEIDRCEAEIMEVPNWYDRYGFVYYAFMKDAYRKPSL